MPIIPSVFQPIRSNDVHQRPIKAYKHYKVTNNSTTFPTSSGYFRHQGVYKRTTPHIDPISGEGVGTLIYPVNAEDNTNQHVIWEQVDHRFYKRNDPANAFDFHDIEKQERFLWYSASILTAPYGQVGERIKPGSVQITSSLPSYAGNPSFSLDDDKEGNLRDSAIVSSSFASSSRNVFYMTFNNGFRDFESSDNLGTYKQSFEYKLNKAKRYSTGRNNVDITDGVTQLSVLDQAYNSGLSAKFGTDGYIRIPHDAKFDRFGKCDDWTISFWHKNETSAVYDHDLITKYAIGTEMYLDSIDGKRKIRDTQKPFIPPISGDFSKIRTPMVIGVKRDTTTNQYFFKSSDGSRMCAISSSAASATGSHAWQHVLIRNSASMCEMFIDGVVQISSGSLPEDPNANNADIIFGAAGGAFAKDITGSAVNSQLAEVRFYDYAVNSVGIESLSNRHYISGSFYQTDVVGNVFYKNGHMVVSSPMAKYQTGSGFFNNTEVRYRGTHTIYENEVLVRVPKDEFNVTMNPSATYKPATEGDVCDVNQKNSLPGELRKTAFVSGTLHPYITTIGLYDEHSRMLAVGKLAQPIQKTDDIDMNFVVRWDY